MECKKDWSSWGNIPIRLSMILSKIYDILLFEIMKGGVSYFR